MADTCRIVALGGLGEVGKNMTVYECDGAIVVVDAGLAFPRDEHLGVDLVLPDFGYLRDALSRAERLLQLLAERGIQLWAVGGAAERPHHLRLLVPRLRQARE